jgi:hypothetical protein
MKTYKEIKDNFFEEVSKIDVSKLSFGMFGGGLKEYAELLKVMADLPDKGRDEWFDPTLQGVCCQITPRINEGGK